MRAHLEIRLRQTGGDLFVVETWQTFTVRERLPLVWSRIGRSTLRSLGTRGERLLSETPPIPLASVGPEFFRALQDYAGDHRTVVWAFEGEDRMKVDPAQVVKEFKRGGKTLREVK